MANTQVKPGIAYGILKCGNGGTGNAPPFSRMRGEVEGIRKSADGSLPSCAGFAVYSIDTGLQVAVTRDGSPREFAVTARGLEGRGANVLIRAMVPGVTNEAAAKAVRTLMGRMSDNASLGIKGETAIIEAFYQNGAGACVPYAPALK
jgi:hypothetical protein